MEEYMSITIRLLTGLFSIFPALFFTACALTTSRDEYFWPTYLIVSLIFIGFSLLLSQILPRWMFGSRFDYPWLWLFIAGGLAWLLAMLSLALLNLTPLCVGQDNGDGINDLGLCFLYTFLFTLIFSPIELVLLLLSAFAGGKILRYQIRS
jgi:hypothetical protein